MMSISPSDVFSYTTAIIYCAIMLAVAGHTGYWFYRRFRSRKLRDQIAHFGWLVDTSKSESATVDAIKKSRDLLELELWEFDAHTRSVTRRFSFARFTKQNPWDDEVRRHKFYKVQIEERLGIIHHER